MKMHMPSKIHEISFFFGAARPAQLPVSAPEPAVRALRV
jgi:hypothetical protein